MRALESLYIQDTVFRSQFTVVNCLSHARCDYTDLLLHKHKTRTKLSEGQDSKLEP